MLAYPCRFEPASRWDPVDEGFVVTCRDMPEVATQGDDMDEAMAMATDALAVALSARAGPKDWPHPSKPERGEIVVTLPPLLAAKVALWASMNEAGISNGALARRLGVTEGVVRRLLSFGHCSHIGRLEAALAILGKRLVPGPPSVGAYPLAWVMLYNTTGVAWARSGARGPAGRAERNGRADDGGRGTTAA